MVVSGQRSTSHNVRSILYAMAAILEINSTIRGYHVYKRHWSAVVGEVMEAKKEEPRNVHDRYAVTLVQEEVGIVGHAGLALTVLGAGVTGLGPGLKSR